MVWPDGRVKDRFQPLSADVPVLVTVRLAVRPLPQALIVLVTLHAAPPGDGFSEAGGDGGVVLPNWVKNCHTSPETQDDPALRSTGSGTWSPSKAAHRTGYPARQPA